MARNMFVNLAVRDLKRSMDFFTKLGFGFDPRFTDDNAASMIVSDSAFVMLLAEPFFKTFTTREICNTSAHTEGLFALSCTSRAEVDQMVHTAIAAGGRHAMDPQDHGFMYGWSFYDLDGHHWEVVYMDEQALPEAMKAKSPPPAPAERYVDGFLIPVPAGRKEEYRAQAAKAAPLFQELGATRVVECWGTDVPDGKLTDCKRAVNAEPGEQIVFSWIEYPSKQVRDDANKKMMEHPGFQALGPMPFDAKRMIFGGFAPILDTKGELA